MIIHTKSLFANKQRYTQIIPSTIHIHKSGLSVYPYHSSILAKISQICKVLDININTLDFILKYCYTKP